MSFREIIQGGDCDTHIPKNIIVNPDKCVHICTFGTRQHMVLNWWCKEELARYQESVSSDEDSKWLEHVSRKISLNVDLQEQSRKTAGSVSLHGIKSALDHPDMISFSTEFCDSVIFLVTSHSITSQCIFSTTRVNNKNFVE